MPTRSRPAVDRMKRDLVGGTRASVIVAGDNRRVRIKDALVSAQSRCSIISPKLVERVGAEIGPRSCTMAQAVGDVCGPTAEVQVSIGRRRVTVSAIIDDMPAGLNLIVGQDVLGKARQAGAKK